jgi:hypothetical protein
MNKQTINYKNNENDERAFLYNCRWSDLVLRQIGFVSCSAFTGIPQRHESGVNS